MTTTNACAEIDLGGRLPKLRDGDVVGLAAAGFPDPVEISTISDARMLRTGLLAAVSARDACRALVALGIKGARHLDDDGKYHVSGFDDDRVSFVHEPNRCMTVTHWTRDRSGDALLAFTAQFQPAPQGHCRTRTMADILRLLDLAVELLSAAEYVPMGRPRVAHPAVISIRERLEPGIQPMLLAPTPWSSGTAFAGCEPIFREGTSMADVERIARRVPMAVVIGAVTIFPPHVKFGALNHLRDLVEPDATQILRALAAEQDDEERP